jgi:hypothetical protein
LPPANGNNHYGSCREGDNVAIKDVKTKWALTQQGSYENCYPGTELARTMEYPWAARQSTPGASSFSADEWMESSPPCDGPEAWPEWKIEDDLAYRQWLDDVFKGYVD